MVSRLIIMLMILATSCQTKTKNWQTLDFGPFTLETPKGWWVIKNQGYDSFVGGLTNGKDTLRFDYGWYTAEIGDNDNKEHLYAQDTINGLTAVLQIPKTDGKGSIVMFIPKVSGKDKFGIAGSNIKGTETILKIYKSIVFDQSDTTKNSLLTRAKFREYPFGSGQTLFRQNCATCHHAIKKLVGPPLKELSQEKSTEWLYKYLTNRKSVVSDSSNKERFAEYGAHCMEFRDLTKNEVAQILEYIKTK